MDRKEFLTLIGMAAGGAIVASCFGCKKSDTSTAAVSKDFTLDLTQPANAALKNNGGYLVSNGVIVAKTTAGAYIAVASSCTHEGTTVSYDGTNNRFHCSNHGANFSNSGAVITGPASTALQQFNTTLTGNSLRVFS